MATPTVVTPVRAAMVTPIKATAPMGMGCRIKPRIVAARQIFFEGDEWGKIATLFTGDAFESLGFCEELLEQVANVVSVCIERNLEFRDTDNGRIELTLTVEGNVRGADKRTLEPLEGVFHCTPDESPDRGYEVRVPRQKDDSLILRRVDSKGEELPSIPLGQLIRKAGFDWTQESLGDVSILADIPASTFQITVLDWEGPYMMTVTI